MEPTNDIMDGMNILDDLFPSIDFSSMVENFDSNDNLQLEDDLPNELLLPTFFDDLHFEDSPTTAGTNTFELTYIFPNDQQANLAILYEQAPIENPNEASNTELIGFPTPQQANGNQDGIMYLIHPSLFNVINGGISVKQQPKANNRSRYSCDGPRFLPDSRYHPMAINLPDLTLLLLENNAQWGIVMTIVTTSNNPKHQAIVHANDIIYRTDDAKKIGYGCVFVPLEKPEIQNGEKKFPRLSIIYKKCDDYTFDLTPFDPITMFGTTEKYVSSNRRNVGSAARAKDFKKDYNLLSYKICFQLAIKQDDIVYISHIACETEIVDEQKAPSTTTVTATKRSASVSTENYSDEESSLDEQMSSSSKKFKPSTPSMTGLPVTYISSSDINFNIDHGQ